MTAEALAFALVLLLAVAAPLALWRLVRAEGDDGPEVDRETAERTARRDTRDDPRSRR